ncbi:hypothetical protein LTR35_010803 [Friedmanniomyces endolithicus]|nr:hypothetical protein LTR35_010803 [Friedmanniomyces endolithicus]KAK0998426.1 hypothetical protein LTR54_009564 [Friedmanniomyces endolithicus]
MARVTSGPSVRPGSQTLPSPPLVTSSLGNTRYDIYPVYRSMSSVPIAPTSHEATNSNYQQPPSTDCDPEDATASGAADSGFSDVANSLGAQDNQRSGQASPSHRPAKPRLRSGAANYRDLFNAVVRDVSREPDKEVNRLPPSLIGASHWSSFEKEMFFEALARCRPGNLLELSRAIGTKSEAEIHVYLRLLQDRVLECDTSLPAKESFSIAELPAAYEVSKVCEAALANAADVLARKVDLSDGRVERAKHGDTWIIDEDLATSIEASLRSEESVKSTIAPDAEKASGEQRVPPVQIRSAELLSPEAFLTLSRNIFMNAKPESGNNWRDLVVEEDGPSSPAIFRTAFDDFYNLAVSLTRRIVQTTLFQANSRLRASDASRRHHELTAEVREVDVRTAVKLLSLRTEWRAHWAGVPRRCGLDVYTEIGKYLDGRPGTKNGVELTPEEVEMELGVGREQDAAGDEPALPGGDGELAESDFDSDDFTELGDDGTTIDLDNLKRDIDETYKTESEDLGGGIAEGVQPNRKRKRVLGPASAKLEDQHIEALDMRAGAEETHRLWKSLGKDKGRANPEALPQAPPVPKLKYAETGARSNVGTTMRYETIWERSGKGVPEYEFKRTEELGRAGREKRRRFREEALTQAHGLQPDPRAEKAKRDLSAEDLSAEDLSAEDLSAEDLPDMKSDPDIEAEDIISDAEGEVD